MHDYSAQIIALEVRIESLDQLASNTHQKVTITSEDGSDIAVVRLEGPLGRALKEESRLMKQQLEAATEAIETLRDLFPSKD